MKQMNTNLSTNNLYNKLFHIIIGIAILLSFNSNLFAQEVTHPISEISNTVKFYSYRYVISETQVKDIEYFIIQAPNGDIKTAFDACDVCYSKYKGYSQNGDKMRCNNCGNQYLTDQLGTQGQGGCWPGYLPHTEVDGQIVIQISDLIKGEYFFRTQQVSDVSENQSDKFPKSYSISINSSILTIQTDIFLFREIQIHDISGNLINSSRYDSDVYNFNTSNWANGVYFITLIEGTKIYNTVILK